MVRYITFASRGDTLNFLMRLKHAGIPAATAPTPVSRGDVCALSVKVDSRYTYEVKTLLSEGGARGFKGIF